MSCLCWCPFFYPLAIKINFGIGTIQVGRARGVINRGARGVQKKEEVVIPEFDAHLPLFLATLFICAHKIS